MDLLTPLLPRPSVAERRAGLVELLSAMAATGLTGAHVMDLGDGSVPAFLAAVEEDTDLPVRLRLAPWCMPGADKEALEEPVRLQSEAGRLWRVGGVKFFMDGTVEGGTAWLEEADCHGQGTEAFWPDPAAYTAAVTHLHRAGVRTATPSGTRPCGTSWTPWRGSGRAAGSAIASSTSSPSRTRWRRGSSGSG